MNLISLFNVNVMIVDLYYSYYYFLCVIIDNYDGNIPCRQDDSKCNVMYLSTQLLSYALIILLISSLKLFLSDKKVFARGITLNYIGENAKHLIENAK